MTVDVQDRTYFFASELVERETYVFSVMAKTDKGWGPPREGTVTTGPQQSKSLHAVCMPSLIATINILCWS